MKAMILAAGLGMRLRPHTQVCPKPLITVQGQPLIVHHLHALKRSGVCDVVINLHHLAAQVKHRLGNGQEFGLRIHYSDETSTGLLGAYGGVRQALEWLGDEPFLLISSDIFTSFDFASLRLPPSCAAHMVMVPNPDWHSSGDFWVLDSVVHPTSGVRHTYANIGIFRPEYFHQQRSPDYAFKDFIAEIMQKGKISTEIFSGDWHNVGTVAQWQQAAGADDRLPE
jgi:MurNAc alpha-1-phosphate uridylyltransferase